MNLELFHRVRLRLEAHPEARLIAVSKRQESSKIEVLYQEGQRDFGENYQQELEAKQGTLPGDIRWHFIGQLQSRKVKPLVAGGVHCIHSIGSPSALGKINSLTPPTGGFLLQVNLMEEEQKGGFSQRELMELAEQGLPEGIVGLMCIPPVHLEGAQLRDHFRQMRQLKESLGLAELSMGMSSDWELALDEGSTMIRMGTALFGPRD